jgi:hypothetical protein
VLARAEKSGEVGDDRRGPPVGERERGELRGFPGLVCWAAAPGRPKAASLL